MIATVGTSANISATLIYGQNVDKGGSLILCNLTDESAGPKQQAKDWEALSNNYKVKIYHVIISFSDKDTIKIRGMPSTERLRFERGIILDFMDELQRRGNNVYDCPFVVAHHGNTDNEHFHISILNTTKDGKHFADSYIKKNACRSAAYVSIKYGLEAPTKAVRNELNHQKANERRKGEYSKGIVSNSQCKKRNYKRVDKDPDELRYRAERIRLAEKRKRSCKFIIESVAKDKMTNCHNFVERLKANGLDLFYDPAEGYYAEMHDESKNKTYNYLLELHLGVNMALLPQLDKSKITKDRKTGKRPVEPQVKRIHVKSTFTNGNIDKSSKGNIISAKGLNVTTGSQGGQTQQGNVNPDGNTNGNGDDDMDEQWRRRSGYRM